VNYRPFLTLSAAIVICPVVFAQAPAEKPLTEIDLLKQIEALTPGSPNAPLPADPRPAGAPKKNDASGASLFGNGPGDPLKFSTAKEKPADAAGDATTTDDKKAKGPTEITALEANFDQKANIAIFIGEVVVKDPEFNVICDKLTAYLKHEEKPKAKPGAPGTTPKAGTPAASSKPGTPSPTATGTPAPKDGQLDHAIAITTSDRRVIITQDKLEADGTITHSIGKGDRATYDANTGEVVLYGSPDAVKGTNHVQATDPTTIITLNRDGRMKAVGPHKTTIVDMSRNDPKNPDGSTPAPGSSPRPAATPRQ